MVILRIFQKRGLNMNKSIRGLFVLACVILVFVTVACNSMDKKKPEIDVDVFSIRRENDAFSVVILVDEDFSGKLLFTLKSKDKSYE